jgi:hypothetical protein
MNETSEEVKQGPADPSSINQTFQYQQTLSASLDRRANTFAYGTAERKFNEEKGHRKTHSYNVKRRFSNATSNPRPKSKSVKKRRMNLLSASADKNPFSRSF